jgi:hypothetical protein
MVKKALASKFSFRDQFIVGSREMIGRYTLNAYVPTTKRTTSIMLSRSQASPHMYTVLQRFLANVRVAHITWVAGIDRFIMIVVWQACTRAAMMHPQHIRAVVRAQTLTFSATSTPR